MAMIKKSATMQKTGQATTTGKTTGEPSPFSVTQEHINMASKDRFITNLLGNRAPEYFAAGIKLTNVGGENQPLFIMPSSATQVQGGGQVAFRQNKDGKTFEMVTVGKDSKGNVMVNPTEEKNLTAADMLNKFGSLTTAFANKAHQVITEGGTLGTSTGTVVNAGKGARTATAGELRGRGTSEFIKK